MIFDNVEYQKDVVKTDQQEKVQDKKQDEPQNADTNSYVSGDISNSGSVSNIANTNSVSSNLMNTAIRRIANDNEQEHQVHQKREKQASEINQDQNSVNSAYKANKVNAKTINRKGKNLGQASQTELVNNFRQKALAQNKTANGRASNEMPGKQKPINDFRQVAGQKWSQNTHNNAANSVNQLPQTGDVQNEVLVALGLTLLAVGSLNLAWEKHRESLAVINRK